MPPSRRLLQVLTVAVSAYYALWACAPAATMRPITDMDVDGNEFGLGGLGSVDLTTDPDARGGCYSGELIACGAGYGGQLWYTHRFSRWFSLGGTLFAGNKSLFGAGIQARFHLVDTESFQFGADLEGGFMYGALGLPVAVRLVDGLWVYSAPSFGARLYQPVRIPLGLAWNVTDDWGISGEATYGFDVLNSPVNVLASDSLTFGIAGSFRF